MAGVSMRGGAEFAKLHKGLLAVQKPAFKRKLLKNLSMEALHQVGECFDGQRDPYGRAWRPLKNPPKKRRGGMILSDRGVLRNSFRANANSRSFEVSSRVIYAAIHLYGGTVVRKGGSVMMMGRDPRTGRYLRRHAVGVRHVSAGTAVIPARPYLPTEKRLGQRWTVAFTRISARVIAAEVGKQLGA